MKPFRGYTHSGSMASVFATICHCSPQQRAIPKWLRHSLDYPWKFQITTGFVESVLTYQYQISLVRLPGSLRHRQTRLWGPHVHFLPEEDSTLQTQQCSSLLELTDRCPSHTPSSAPVVALCILHSSCPTRSFHGQPKVGSEASDSQLLFFT